MKRIRYLALGLLLLCLTGCGSEAPEDNQSNQTSQNSQDSLAASQARTIVTDIHQTAPDDPRLVILPSGVRYIDLVVGDGEELVHGAYFQWDYSLFISDEGGHAKVRAQTSTVGKPDQFYRGQAGITGLRGLAEGCVGMKVGSTRRIHIPAALGYGDKGPMAHMNLIFEIQNLELITERQATNWRAEQAADRQKLRERQDSISRALGR